MGSLKHSIFISVGEKYSIFLIQLILTIIIARLLSPKEIGIFSIGSIVLALTHAVRDLGISNYLIQEKEFSADRLRTAQTLMIALSWSLALIIGALSPHIASFYAEPGIKEVIFVLTLNFILLPFGAVSMALLRRNMQFGMLLKINIVSSAVHASVAISLCLLDFGFISLAWAGVAGATVTVVGSLLAAKERVPLRPAIPEWRRVLKIGGRFSGASLLWEAGFGSPEIIVGKAMSIEHAGYLGRAFGVVNLAYRTLMEGLAPVLMPFFAKESRAGSDIGQQVCKAIYFLSALTLPLFACLAIAMDAIVLLLYGDQWVESIEPARILCFGMAVLSLAVVAGTAISGMGESKYTLRIQLVGQPVKILLILLASNFSLLHVALAMAVGDMLIAAYTLAIFTSLTKATIKSIFTALLPSLAITFFAITACTAFRLTFEGIPIWLSVFGCISFSMLGWLLGISLTQHEIGKLIYSYLRKLIH